MADNDILDFGIEEEEQKEELLDKFSSNVLTAKNMNIFRPCDVGGALRILTFEVEATTDYNKGTTFSLCRLPQGVIRILGSQSKIDCKISGKSLKVGWAKYKDRHRQIISENLSGFGELKKGAQSFLKHLSTQMLKVDSLEGVFLVASANQSGKKSDKIEGYIVYVKT